MNFNTEIKQKCQHFLGFLYHQEFDTRTDLNLRKKTASVVSVLEKINFLKAEKQEFDNRDESKPLELFGIFEKLAF